MDKYSLATLRLGKTSVDDIKAITHLDAGILSAPYSIDVTCTQVPAEADADTYVLIWLGSDNSKGMSTEWKQGFRAFGIINSIDRGESFNDDSTLHVNILYVLENAINRLDILQTAQQLYYHCSALPIVGIDDHSNQTIRLLNGIEERGSINAFFCALDLVDNDFRKSICSIDNGLSQYFVLDGINIATVNTTHYLEPSVTDYITQYDNLTYSKSDLLNIFKEIYDKTVDGERISDEITFGIQYCKHLKGLGITFRKFAKEALGPDTADSIGDEISRGVKLGERLRKHLTVSHVSSATGISSSAEDYDRFLRALRTKPFLLLAGISGTGKSRIVRELAFKSCPVSLQDADGTTPGNYLMVEVKPNWHDSSELLGYYSNLKPGYIYTDFIKFAVKATQSPDVPFFVCLDEMNLAPVEQYFAEFLSILETRKAVSGKILSGELVSADNMKAFPGWPSGKALTLPDNLFVIGTVNMDDTTHQFSRKVIDRAMTIEMNGGDLSDMFGRSQDLEYLPASDVWKLKSFAPEYVTADEALDKHPSEAEQMKKDLTEHLQAINKELENTPFQVSYRVLNELCIYTAVLLDDGFAIDEAIEEAVDQIALMKILPRIEGDEDLFSIRNENVNKLDKLKDLFDPGSDSWKKLDEMNKRLGNGGGFTRFWP